MLRTIIQSALLPILAIASLLNACKPGDDPEPQKIDPKAAHLAFHIHNVFGNKLIKPFDEYAFSGSGRKITFDYTDFYVSHFSLVREDGSELQLDKIFLITNDEEEFNLGEVPAGKYKGIKFYMGLDSATNHSDISTYPAGHPLAIQPNAMHWSWEEGYLFMKIEGYVDTTVALAGNPNSRYFYHIATDDFYKQMSFTNISLELQAEEKRTLVLQIDYEKMFDRIDMTTTRGTHTYDNLKVAEDFWSNLENACKVE